MTRPYTLLIVDDEDVVCRALARLLAAPGRRVVTADGGGAAMAVVDREPVDLVISDKDMGDLTGLELLARIRARQPLAVAMILTGNATLPSALTAINDQGVFRYLTKPWNDAELIGATAAALARADELQREAAVQRADARRADARAALAAADPALLAVPAGAYPLAAGALTVELDALVQAARAGTGPTAAARGRAAAAAVRGGPGALADALGAALVHSAGTGVVVSAGTGAWTVALEVGAARTPLLDVPRLFGVAVAGRLALLAGVDLGSDGEALGRLPVIVDGVRAELMVAYDPAGGGVELRRLGGGGPARLADALAGRYLLGRKLGDGGTGEVYEATHLGLDRPVALKVLRPSSAADPTQVARFLREARAPSRARHPAIVEVHDHGQLPDGRPYLAMELVAWPTLEARIADGPLAVDAAVAVARRICDGLEVAHAAGIIHRDLKPANLFVSDALDVKIADFGAALVVGAGAALTQEGWTVGTPAYMAPEQIAARPADHRLDLYAVGCMLVEMITGAPPFRAPTLRELLVQHLSAPPPDVDVPPPLARVIRRTLAKHPHDRPASAAALADALADATRPSWRPWSR